MYGYKNNFMLLILTYFLILNYLFVSLSTFIDKGFCRGYSIRDIKWNFQFSFQAVSPRNTFENCVKLFRTVRYHHREQFKTHH